MTSLTKVPAVILCGGLGTRLRSVLPDRAKCLAPINGRPFLEFLLDYIESSGFRRVVLCLGYKSDQVVEFIKSREPWKIQIAWAVEDEPLGTAGAVMNVEPLLDEDCFVVMNGDTILELDFNRLIEVHRERAALATLTLKRLLPGPKRYGCVGLGSDGRIMSFSEKAAPLQGARQPDRDLPLINGGVYVVSKELLARIPSAPPPVSLETQVFPSLIGTGLYGLPWDGYFLDIGVPEDYERAQKELPGRFQCG